MSATGQTSPKASFFICNHRHETSSGIALGEDRNAPSDLNLKGGKDGAAALDVSHAPGVDLSPLVNVFVRAACRNSVRATCRLRGVRRTTRNAASKPPGSREFQP